MGEQPLRPSEVLGRQVKVWRDQRKLSAQGLADRIRDLGGTLSRVAISKIENGDRGVGLDEWLQLAHALAVPPPLLFVDLQSGADVAVAPGVVLHPWLLWEWATGEQPPLVRAPEGGAYASRVEEFGRAKTAIHIYRREGAAGRAINRAESDLSAAEYTGDEGQLLAARSAYVDALREMAKALDDMIEHDMTPPGKPTKWIDAIRELRLSRYPDRLIAMDADGER
ncbi:helix-turn-helix transcriptional regulator [Micromonospora sp. NPDC050695]|uniref:helix-turn-helix domain-containing protein n=1 Tax=Micromonospora sp. NPDC050695 TaxID=3154938 RepID=UPI0033C54AA3